MQDEVAEAVAADVRVGGMELHVVVSAQADAAFDVGSAAFGPFVDVVRLGLLRVWLSRVKGGIPHAHPPQPHTHPARRPGGGVMTLLASSPAPDTSRMPSGEALVVSYLRASTKEQAEKGGKDEGFSIPAQRDANQRKADTLGAVIVEEFVDAGESAKSAHRPALQRMIQYVKAHKVAYCIVHKVDRLARNRADDVAIHFALQEAGVMLVSATENIDETPSGMLLHGIMSTIAEFYSRNLATEVVKGIVPRQVVGRVSSISKLGMVGSARPA
ncbi:MAG: recombinase family protein [Microbacterium sp.]